MTAYDGPDGDRRMCMDCGEHMPDADLFCEACGRSHARGCSDDCPDDQADLLCAAHMPAPHAIDRIDDRGDITEHLTYTDKRTLCGRPINQSQAAIGNGPCRACSRIDAPRAALRLAAVADLTTETTTNGAP